MRPLKVVSVVRTQVVWSLTIALAGGCGQRHTTGGVGEDTGEETGEETQGESEDTEDTEGPETGKLDTIPEPVSSDVDILFVVDNSPSMRDEQRNVAANIRQMWTRMLELEDSEGNPGLVFESSLHIMVTTTDLGGPQCGDVPGYEPAAGSPITLGCNARIDEFVTDADDVSAACTQVCPIDVVPQGPFIATEIGGASNVPEDDIGSALACLGAQGVVGCEYGQPLEAMLRALDPDAAWNAGPDGFLRADSAVVVVLISDQPDCSFADPGIFEDAQLMNLHPESGQPELSHAVCWNAGVACTPTQDAGVYEDCVSVDDRLHPVERYVERLREELIFDEERPVLMLAALGVPEVTHHNDQPPFEPIVGGIHDLVYRDWRDGAWPAGDLLPGEGPTAAHEQWRHGIGPGCAGTDGMGGFLGHATPPVRAAEVCESLDSDDALRCCIESVCDGDFSALVNCMYGTAECPVFGRGEQRCILPW